MHRSLLYMSSRNAFTLVEMLSVVSIVALILSLLLPALARARTQAKITTCQANIRQLGMLVSMYQAESADFVPLLFDYWSNLALAGSKPAEQCWLSVALRRYDSQTRNLDAKRFDPTICWPDPPVAGLPRVQEYQRKVMPELYSCPFERGNPAWPTNPVRDDRGDYWELRFGGRWESYHTWTDPPPLLGRWKPGPLAKYDQMYPTLHFNRGGRHRKWNWRDAKAAGRGSLAELTTVFCAQGEFMSTVHAPAISCSCSPMRPFWANIGSHRQGHQGGTNALFADTHVEWIPGHRIGSP